MMMCNSFIALLCDPQYKLKSLKFLFDVEGGVNSAGYKTAKAHFQHTFSQYQRCAVGLAEWDRQVKENTDIDALDGRDSSLEASDGQCDKPRLLAS
jgi:hypothetical protein